MSNNTLESIIWNSTDKPVFKSAFTGYRIYTLNTQYVALRGWTYPDKSGEVIHLGTRPVLDTCIDLILKDMKAVQG